MTRASRKDSQLLDVMIQLSSYPAWWKLSHRAWASCRSALPKRLYMTVAVTFMRTFGPSSLSFSCTFSLVWNPAPNFCLLLRNVISKNYLVPHLTFCLVPFNLSNVMISAENVLWYLEDSIYGLNTTTKWTILMRKVSTKQAAELLISHS